MKENTQEKNLIEKKEESLFGKIKNFFRKIFKKKEVVVDNMENSTIETNDFKDSIKITEDEEMKLLELQRRYRHGEVAVSELSDEQIDALCDLYDKQIEKIQKSIEIKTKKLDEYKKRKQEKNNA